MGYLMSNHKKDGKYVDVYRMMDYAESLLHVAKVLQQKNSEPNRDVRLFEGVFLSVPILLTHATEIALKAWQFREFKEVNTRTHDLLKLFESLKPSTQKMLEARMRKVSPNSIWSEDPRFQNQNPDVQEMFAAKMNPLRDVLRSHSDLNVRWRFLYEERYSVNFDTGEIQLALTVLIESFSKNRKVTK